MSNHGFLGQTENGSGVVLEWSVHYGVSKERKRSYQKLWQALCISPIHPTRPNKGLDFLRFCSFPTNFSGPPWRPSTSRCICLRRLSRAKGHATQSAISFRSSGYLYFRVIPFRHVKVAVHWVRTGGRKLFRNVNKWGVVFQHLFY